MAAVLESRKVTTTAARRLMVTRELRARNPVLRNDGDAFTDLPSGRVAVRRGLFLSCMPD
jgi:hypothetical protein